MSINTSHIDLIALAGTQLKRKGADEYAGACPVCGGDDRFYVQPNRGRWGCRGCKTGGDAIALQMHMTGQTFLEAVEALKLESQLQQKEEPRPQPVLMPKPRYDLPPEPAEQPGLDNDAWIDNATKFVEWSWMNLFSGKYPDVMRYLIEQRGLDENILDLHMIGYNPNTYQRTWGGIEVYLRPGIIIPFLDAFDGRARAVNIRLETEHKNLRYKMVTGSSGKWLFNHYNITPNCNVILVEGEFDALAIRSAVKHHSIVPVATGSTGGARLQRWLFLLGIAKRVLVAFDNDEAGHSASQWWLDRLPRSRRLIPTDHDVNDMLIHGQSIASWINQGLAS